MNIVRIWLYSVTREGLKHPECKPSDTNKIEAKEVRGDFIYYDVSNNSPRKTNRAEADKWSKETGHKIETWRGYPSWMYDMGYKV